MDISRHAHQVLDRPSLEEGDASSERTEREKEHGRRSEHSAPKGAAGISTEESTPGEARRRRARKPLHETSGLPQKRGAPDLQRQYRVTLEAGLVLALLVTLGLFRAPIQPVEKELQAVTSDQEIVQMEEIRQTEQVEPPPAPPRPPAPIAVPDDEVLDDEVLNLDASLDLDEPVSERPPPPPPPDEEEDVEEEEPEIFVIVEEMPELIGGIASLQRKIRYPALAQKAGIEGRVIVQFVVNPEGRVENAQVVRGIGGGCDEEALRVVRMAEFEPGRQRGKPVPVRMTIPVTFRLE